MITKYYDPQVAEAPAGDTQVEKVSVASLMAKAGVLNNSDSPVATPIDVKDINKSELAEPVATTTTANSDDSNTTKETPKPTEEHGVAENLVEATPSNVQSWQEVLKQQQPDTVLKELGFNEKAIRLAQKLNGFEKLDYFEGLINTWETNGDLVDYLREMTTDYKKMPAEEVMRHQLRLEYPKASEKALEVLYRKEVVEKYKLDSVDDEEAEEGRLLLEAKAEKYRDELVSRQQSKLFPKPPENKQAEQEAAEMEAKKAIEDYKSQVLNNSFAKEVITSGKLTIGDGDEKFTYPVKPSELTDVLFDSNKWQETQFDIVRDKDGSIKSFSPKVEHQLLTAAVALYGKSFLNEYAKHFKAIGSKHIIETIDNAKPLDGSTPSGADSSPKSVAEAMAKQGYLNSGGFRV